MSQDSFKYHGQKGCWSRKKKVDVLLRRRDSTGTVAVSETEARGSCHGLGASLLPLTLLPGVNPKISLTISYCGRKASSKRQDRARPDCQQLMSSLLSNPQRQKTAFLNTTVCPNLKVQWWLVRLWSWIPWTNHWSGGPYCDWSSLGHTSLPALAVDSL